MAGIAGFAFWLMPPQTAQVQAQTEAQQIMGGADADYTGIPSSPTIVVPPSGQSGIFVSDWNGGNQIVVPSQQGMKSYQIGDEISSGTLTPSTPAAPGSQQAGTEPFSSVGVVPFAGPSEYLPPQYQAQNPASIGQAGVAQGQGQPPVQGQDQAQQSQMAGAAFPANVTCNCQCPPCPGTSGNTATPQQGQPGGENQQIPQQPQVPPAQGSPPAPATQIETPR